MKRAEKFAYGALFAICAACTLIFTLVSPNLIGTEWNRKTVVPNNIHKEASGRQNLNNTAYVFLGLGATAHQLNCPAAIESLVRYGGWGGKVFLVTDQGNCFDRQKMIKDSGIHPDNLKMVVVEEDFGGGGIDIWNSKVGFSKNRLRSKSMKTKLFDIIDDPSIQVLAYVDCDILFGQEGCPARFVDNGVPWEDRNIRFSRIGEDPDTGRLTNIHTGTIVMHRQYSKETLQRWYDRLASGVDDMDRTAYLMEYNDIQDRLDTLDNITFNHTIVGDHGVISVPQSHLRSRRLLSEHHNHNHTHAHNRTLHTHATAHDSINTYAHSTGIMRKSSRHNVMMPSELSYIDENGKKIYYERFVDPYNMTTLPCMTHVSKARCDQFGRKAIQSLVDRFQLRTYSQGYMYCPNPVLAPVLYGWFPLSYLPFCPKIEMFH